MRRTDVFDSLARKYKSPVGPARLTLLFEFIDIDLGRFFKLSVSNPERAQHVVAEPLSRLYRDLAYRVCAASTFCSLRGFGWKAVSPVF